MSNADSSLALDLDFKKLQSSAFQTSEVIPVVIQDKDTLEVLIVGYTNEVAFKQSVETKKVTFWSTSRNEIWVKGATSGDVLTIHEMRVNCEQNSLLYLVRPQSGGACHVKLPNGQTRRTCYFRELEMGSKNLKDLGV